MNKDEAIRAMVCNDARVKLPKDTFHYHYANGNFYHGETIVSTGSMPRKDYVILKGVWKRTYCFKRGKGVGAEIELTTFKYASEKEAIQNIGDDSEVVGVLQGSEEMVF